MSVRPISVPYIPESDPDALRWMANFHQVVQPRPTAFGLDARDVATLGDLIRNFDEKGESKKDIERIIARNAAVRTVQRLVALIQDNTLTSDDDRALLGLPSTGGRG